MSTYATATAALPTTMREGVATDATRWEREQRGSADRHQLQAYAVAVTVALTGKPMTDDMLTCPLTGETFHVMYGEVDKANPALGYVPGNVAMVSKRGNQGRSTLQQHHGDMPGAARYVGDVQAASVGIPVLRKTDATPLVKSWGRGGFESAVMGGAYGIA